MACGCSRIEAVVHHLKHAAAVEEAGVDGAHRRFLGAVDALLDVQHQDLVELRHRLGRPVVAMHQHFRRTLRARGFHAEAVGHGGLQVEHQAVLAPPGDQVQPRADQPQHAFVLVQLAHLEGRDQPLRRQLGPAAAQPGGARHPDHHLQVAQAARAFLAVGLERVGRVLVLDVALAHLQLLGAQEGARVDRCVGRLAEAGEQLARAAQEARFEQRRLHRHVALRLLDAFVDAAHRRADFHPDVPAGVHEGLDRRAQRVGRRPGVAGGRSRRIELRPGRQQHQHIDVRVGEELAAPVAADGDQRGAGRHRGQLPKLGQRVVGLAGQPLGQPRGGQGVGALVAKALQQLGLVVAEAFAHRRQVGRRAWGFGLQRLKQGRHGFSR